MNRNKLFVLLPALTMAIHIFPAQAGSETITLRATNQAGQSTEQTFTLNVSPASHGEWVFIPESSISGITVPAFAVMKYEAAGNPAAPAAGTTSAAYTWTECRTACQALGAGYDMIKESQWNRIAHDMLNTPDNWDGGAVGSGKLFNGIATAAASSTNDADGYTGATGASKFERRTMVLSTGDILWDFARSRNEWTYADDGRTTATSGRVIIYGVGGSPSLTYTGYTAAPVGTKELNETPFQISNRDCKPGGSYTSTGHNVGIQNQETPSSGYTIAYPERGYRGIFGWYANYNSWSSSRTAGCRCVLNDPPGVGVESHTQNP